MEAQFAVFQDSRIEVTLYLAQRASAPALAIFFIAFLFLDFVSRGFGRPILDFVSYLKKMS